ncbi:MAG TPA: MFS transporter [Gemmatimonadales bacterium]
MAVLMAVAFIDMIGLMMVLPLMPLYAKSLHASPTMVGVLVASFSIAQLLSSPVWGRVSDRYGRRPVLLVGLTASAIAYVVFGFANALWLLFVSRFVQGLGGGTTGVAQAYVADTMVPSERAKALGWLSAATSAGVIIGPALGSLVAGLGQSGPGLLAAALCLVNVLFAGRWLPESRVLPQHAPTASGHMAPPPTPRPVNAAIWDVIRHPGRPVARMIWIYAVAMLAYTATPPIFALYLSWRFGITAQNIGYFFVVFGVVGVLMRAFVVGWVNERLGEVRTLRMGAALYGLGYALIPLAVTVPQFLVVQVLLPLGTALLFPATSALVSHHSSKHEFGLMLGVQQAFRGVASVIAPVLAGAAYEHLGPSVPFFGCAVIIACALLLAVRVPSTAPGVAAAAAVAH